MMTYELKQVAVAPYRQSDGWPPCPPGYQWGYNLFTRQYEMQEIRSLTYGSTTTIVDPMARTEVVEYTTDQDGGDSSSIGHVYYNANTERLTVAFKRGGLYSYDGVTEDLFSDFMEAESLGQFFHDVFQKPGDKWEGAKHVEARTIFKQIDHEAPTVEPDLDALKPESITLGKGKRFKLHFTYSANGQMEVRAEDVQQAVKLFKEYMADHGFTAEVNEVTLNLADL